MSIANLLPLLQAAADGAAQIAQAASQVETNKELGVFAGQIPTAFWVVWILERLKKSERFHWINDNSARINRALGIIGATLASAGINWSVQGSVLQGAGGTITITLPAVGHLVHFVVFDMARSYGVQQMFYKVLTGSQAPSIQTPIKAILVRTEPQEPKA